MKKITIYIFIFYLILSSLYAQTPKWVSTEIQNRVAVIEQFTGIFCEAAAVADKSVEERLERYPDKVIIINNHCSSYATPEPGSNYPDLRTDEGGIIFNKEYSNAYAYNREWLKFFPLGALNRYVLGRWYVDNMYYSWITDYNTLTNNVNFIINKSSIVNVYIKPEIDINTRELTVEVEYYYTDDSQSSENYLTVMLLQNEINCYQATNTSFNEKHKREDSLYCHNYVLRKILSDGGAWGDPITTTTKGSYGLRKYTTILPDSIRNVPLDITNLEVIAFISEADSNIYTGHRAVVEIPEDIRTDLTIEDLTEYHNTYKFETIHPKVKVTNKSVLPVTKFDAVYTLTNSQNVVSKKETYLGLLNKDESAILEFPEITNSDLRVGSKYIAEASVESIFSDDKELIDSNKTDNKTKTTKMGLLENAFDKTQLTFEQSNPVLYEEFVPPHTIFDNTLNPHFKIFTGACGAKNTANGVIFYLYESWNVANKPGYIMFGEVDCQEHPNKVLSYYYAYSNGMFNGTAPRIVTEISKDWGITWETVSEITCEETGLPESITQIYKPKSEEYKYVRVDLSNYVQENFIIRVGDVPGTSGNTLWIDEITLTNIEEESIKDDIKFALYPNPTTNILHISNNSFLGAEYEIYDMSGKLIIKDINNSNIINVDNLTTGTYSLKIKDSIFNFIKE